jgi:hypothetical protein
MSVFIPPEGAMQFELTKDWNGPIPKKFTRRGPIRFWIVPHPEVPYLHSLKPDCPHKVGYWPIIETMPDWFPGKANAVSSLHSPIRFAVCECVGRIVE